ncbi:recombinase [Bacillus sp. FJAT-18017]|uniref:recombinase family protein n=1 Tax=Bacillus sp. FJAT-18017 TaxID=1705566 RepID=UPI0006B04BB4|nr:recombinase family protein [Bacillus sp. FJAT-18017]ALC92087.1 recombinase [Bacillus sp. FJAT-18017]
MASRLSGLHIFIYLRKSRSDVEEERRAADEGWAYDTLARHRKNLMEVIKREGHVLVDKFEELVTGESIVERTELQKMLKRMDEGAVDAVLVMDVDRLGRGDMYDSGILDRAFRYNNVKLLTPTEIFDPEEESWELVFSVKSLVARQELKSITKRLQGGRRDKAKSGKSISKKPPYGYLRDSNLKLYPDPETAWVVKKIFELTVSGQGRQAISNYLDSKSISPPDPKREFWSPSTITAIIKNEVYIGKIIWGKITYKKRGGNYVRKVMKPEEWIVKENAHEPLVSNELFVAANTAHTGRWRASTNTTKTLSNPLAGILKCELCGFTMLHGHNKSRPNASVRCNKPSCRGKQKSALLPLVEERILNSLEEYVKEFEVKVSHSAERENLSPQLGKLLLKKEKEKAEYTKQKNKLHDFLERGIYDIDTFMERQATIGDNLKTIEAEMKSIQDEIEIERVREKQVLDFLPRTLKVLETYRQTDDIVKKNQLLKSVLEKVTYRRHPDSKKSDEFEIQLYLNI